MTCGGGSSRIALSNVAVELHTELLPKKTCAFKSNLLTDNFERHTNRTEMRQHKAEPDPAHILHCSTVYYIQVQRVYEPSMSFPKAAIGHA